MSRLYVYSLAYPNGEVFYIGKGAGSRLQLHAQVGMSFGRLLDGLFDRGLHRAVIILRSI